MNKVKEIQGNIIHAIAKCLLCDWEYECQINALRLAKNHTLETGHETMVEIGRNIRYVKAGK